MSGTVTFRGRPVDSGEVRFVPIGDARGPIGTSRIIKGKYSISARGGVVLGNYRIEIEAFEKTGRKVSGKGPYAEETVEEEVPVGPAIYAGEESPLQVHVTRDTELPLNFDLPAT